MSRKVSLQFLPYHSEGNCSYSTGKVEEELMSISKSGLIVLYLAGLTGGFCAFMQHLTTSLALGKTSNGKAFMLLP